MVVILDTLISFPEGIQMRCTWIHTEKIHLCHLCSSVCIGGRFLKKWFLYQTRLFIPSPLNSHQAVT